MSTLFPQLFTPFTLGPLTLRNRIVSSGHDTVLDEQGKIGPDLVAYHRERAAGGAGLIVLQVSGVHETARYTNHVLMATEDAAIPGYQAVAQAVHQEGSHIIAQLFHPGREVMDGERGMAPQAVAPSDEPQERFHVVPQPLTTAQVQEIIAGYGTSAARIVSAGIDGVEIVASHGYLPIQFVNPRVNTRTDAYGGSAENRRRFLLETIATVRQAVGESKVVGLRISGDELSADGLTSTDISELIRQLDTAGGLDYISVTAGDSSTLQGAWHIVPSMQIPTAYATDLSAAIKKVTSLPVMVAGRINQPQEAEAALATGSADLAIMTRALICDPQLANKAARDAVDEIRACIGCNQACIGHFQKGVGISCIQYPESGRELTFLPRPRIRSNRRVLVIGGGPAGLKAAAVAAEAGCQVKLFEASARVGGQVVLAETLPFRAEFGGAATNLLAEAQRAGVDIRTRCQVDQAVVDEVNAEHVIIATGSTERLPHLDILDDATVYGARDYLHTRPHPAPGNVLIADWKGDWIGLGIALELAAKRRRVTVATAANFPGAAIQQYTRTLLMAEAVKLGVTFINDVRLVGVDEDTGYLQSTLTDLVIEVPEISTTIVSHAPRSHRPSLDYRQAQVHVIGDAKSPRTVEEAVYEGLLAATSAVRA